MGLSLQYKNMRQFLINPNKGGGGYPRPKKTKFLFFRIDVAPSAPSVAGSVTDECISETRGGPKVQGLVSLQKLHFTKQMIPASLCVQ